MNLSELQPESSMAGRAGLVLRFLCTRELLWMATAFLPEPEPVDPALSAAELLTIVARLYRELQAAPRDQQPALIARIRWYADRYRQLEASL